MWAFGCGVVSSGMAMTDAWPAVIAGVVLAGPLVCGTSQAVNDWFDRHVDAINEPTRPIPSGRIPGRWGLIIAVVWTCLSLVVGALLGAWVLGGTVLGLTLAWAYSAPPVRLKRNGWWGNTAVGLSYEGLTWFTGAAVMIGTWPDWRIVLFAFLYGLGAHGIMTLNDFKSVTGDLRMGVRTLPVQLGEATAARVACLFMVVPQLVVIALFMSWHDPVYAAIIGLLVIAQFVLMVRFLKNPSVFARWFTAASNIPYVSGMMISAFALGAAPWLS